MDNFLSRLKSIADQAQAASPERSDVKDRETEQKPETSLTEPAAKLPEHSDTTLPPPAKRARRRAGSQPWQAFKRQPNFRKILFGLAFLAAGAGTGLVYGYHQIKQTLPDTSDILTFRRDGTMTIKASDGAVLYHKGPATRDRLTLKQIPPKLVNAFIASEDRRFYNHDGVDYQSVARATVANLLARETVEGGSTITQQLSRIVYLDQERSLARKLREAVLAQKIESKLSKDQVLEQYLNLVYLGSNAYGVGDAAWIYFGKSVNQLTLSEMATIAGLPPAPSTYSPLVNPKTAAERRNIVLARMEEGGYITAAQVAAAEAEPLKLNPKLPKKFFSDSPYFTTYVIEQELKQRIPAAEIKRGGLTIETSLNPKWQKPAEQAVQQAVKTTGRYQRFKQGALVAADPKTGEIRAMVGGADNDSQFNRATQAQRQPGSAFKAILYTTAIATGKSPYASYLDAPFMVDGYKPENANRKNNGWMSLKDALTNSVNVISVKLLIDIGFDPVIQMARNLGIKSKLVPAYSLALGTSEVNLLEMTSAYGTLANQGKHLEIHGIRRVVNRKGEVIYNASFKPKSAVDPASVAIATWMMEGVVQSGTATNAQLGRPVAGKTGTTENARDLWFIGFIPQLVAGVWLGNDDNHQTYGASSTAAYVWRQFMKFAVQNMPVEKFPKLPQLEGRKGSIKAKRLYPRKFQTVGKLDADGKPIPGTAETSDTATDTNTNTSRRRRRSNRSEPPKSSQPEPAEPTTNDAPVVRSEPAPARYNDAPVRRKRAPVAPAPPATPAPPPAAPPPPPPPAAEPAAGN